MTKTFRLPGKQALFCLAVFAINNIFAQTIRYVNAGVSGGANNGSSWVNAYNDLQPALAAAQSGDQIWVAKGTYYPTTSATNRNAYFNMKNNVGIYGGFIGTETLLSQSNWTANSTVLSGDIDRATDPLVVSGSSTTLTIAGNAGNSYIIVYASGLDKTAILNGFTITGGSAYNNLSGGIDIYDASPSFTNLVLYGNYGPYGGGLGNINSSPTLVNLTFSSNSSQYGGGMNCNSGSPTLSNVIFSGNRSMYSGGGMTSSNSATPTLTNVVFSANSSNQGGGMENDYSSAPSLNNVIFLFNYATQGGAIYNYATSGVTINNATFYANYATGGGGGILNDYASCTINNSIFSNNGLNYNPTVAGADIQLGASSSGSPTSATINYSALQLTNNNYNNPSFTINSDLFAQNARFVNPNIPAGGDGIFGTADDGLTLQSTSPCINKGSNSGVPTGVTTDFAGMPRIAGGTVDMGAYEAQSAVLPLQLLNFNGNRQANSNLLQWTTTNESGIKAFIVESSANGSNFSPIGSVTAIGGGNYSFTDNKPIASRTYYRLKMMDTDGQFTYSNVIWINSIGASGISLYPNPVFQATTLNIGNNAGLIGTQAQLIDANGRVVKLITITHNQEQLDMTMLPAGLYILKLNDGSVVKLMKQ